MHRIFLLTFISIHLVSNVFAFHHIPPIRFKFYYENLHTIYIENGYLFGNYKGFRTSINYDGIIKSYQYLILTLRVGAGYSFAQQKDTASQQKFIFPISIHFQLSKTNVQAGYRRYNIRNAFQRLIQKTNLDLAIGWYNYADRITISPFFLLGIRHQKPDGGFMYRISGELFIEHIYRKKFNDYFFYGPSISIGYTF